MLGLLGSTEVRAGHLLPLNTEIKPFAFHICYLQILRFPGGSAVKNLLAIQETQVQSLDQEDPLEEEMATHSSILAWKIPRTEEPGGLQSMGSQKGRHDLATKQQEQLTDSTYIVNKRVKIFFSNSHA